MSAPHDVRRFLRDLAFGAVALLLLAGAAFFLLGSTEEPRREVVHDSPDVRVKLPPPAPIVLVPREPAPKAEPAPRAPEPEATPEPEKAPANEVAAVVSQVVEALPSGSVQVLSLAGAFGKELRQAILEGARALPRGEGSTVTLFQEPRFVEITVNVRGNLRKFRVDHEAPPVPQWTPPGSFLGIRSCGGAACHSRPVPRSPSPALTELDGWTRKPPRDPHAMPQAGTLAVGKGERILSKLKTRDTTRCLSCHGAAIAGPDLDAAVVASRRELQGRTFEEGMSCESCHGPAEKWLSVHASADWASRQLRERGAPALQAELGFVATKDPRSWARTCARCHETMPLDIEAAGHLLPSFEVVGASRRVRHWEERHGRVVALWAEGQLVGLELALRELATREDAKRERRLPLVERAEAHALLLAAVVEPREIDPVLASLREIRSKLEPTEPGKIGLGVTADLHLLPEKLVAASIVDELIRRAASFVSSEARLELVQALLLLDEEDDRSDIAAPLRQLQHSLRTTIAATKDARAKADEAFRTALREVARVRGVSFD